MLALAAACGRVGSPQPPFIRIPEAVKDLSVTQSGHDLVLTWTNPPRYVDGSGATNLAKVQIRANGSLLATLDVTAAGQAQSYAVPIGSMTTGDRTFTAIVETSQGRLSEVSNSVSITPVEVPGAISISDAYADQKQIFLRWSPPQEHAELVGGYIVTRTDLPAETAVVTDTSYVDSRYTEGKTFTYHVTPARRIGERVIPGVGPQMATVDGVDKRPPGAPKNVEITQSLLTWEPNEETDVAGYRVFRGNSLEGEFKPLTERPITATLYNDPSYQPGSYYRVSAVDESRNEGPMSAPFRAP